MDNVTAPSKHTCSQTLPSMTNVLHTTSADQLACARRLYKANATRAFFAAVSVSHLSCEPCNHSSSDRRAKQLLHSHAKWKLTLGETTWLVWLFADQLACARRLYKHDCIKASDSATAKHWPTWHEFGSLHTSHWINLRVPGVYIKLRVCGKSVSPRQSTVSKDQSTTTPRSQANARPRWSHPPSKNRPASTHQGRRDAAYLQSPENAQDNIRAQADHRQPIGQRTRDQRGSNTSAQQEQVLWNVHGWRSREPGGDGSYRDHAVVEVRGSVRKRAQRARGGSIYRYETTIQGQQDQKQSFGGAPVSAPVSEMATKPQKYAIFQFSTFWGLPTPNGH